MANKRTLHFVYSTPQGLADKIIMALFRKRVDHPSWERYAWPDPVRAPLSITYQIARHFSSRYRIRLYDLRERTTIEPDKGDILLGHMWPDPQSVMWRSLGAKNFSKRYVIAPYNHEPRQVLWFRQAVEQCDKYFAICGKYWIDTFDRSPFRDFAHKIVHLNMALDARDYPFVKRGFNPPGRRRFFYIGRYGRYGDEKGIGLLERLAGEIPGFAGGYICEGGEIRGWERISAPTRLTPEFIARIAEDYDCFINMSRADAQATTVLEAMSWGFPVACTRESGYADGDLFFLDLEDERGNMETIRKIQGLSERELTEISISNRRAVETRYSWESFLSTLEKNIAE
ncbi:MAG: hypothetical protein HYV06_09090 [Deltaproteobacteria bacterium]|nr:hypothetical protein [Deltaproteobacteria bacterium]